MGTGAPSPGVKFIGCEGEQSHPSGAKERIELYFHSHQCRHGVLLNTLRTGDADLRFHITTVQDG